MQRRFLSPGSAGREKGMNIDKSHYAHTPLHTHVCIACSCIWKTHTNYVFNVKFMGTQHARLDAALIWCPLASSNENLQQLYISALCAACIYAGVGVFIFWHFYIMELLITINIHSIWNFYLPSVLWDIMMRFFLVSTNSVYLTMLHNFYNKMFTE